MTKIRRDRNTAIRIGDFVARVLDPHVQLVRFVGSIRREVPEVGDVDLLVVPKDPEAVIIEAFRQVCVRKHLESAGDALAIGMCNAGGTEKSMSVNVFMAPMDELGAAMHYTTGPRDYNLCVRWHAKRRGLWADQHGVFKRLPGDRKGPKIPYSGEREQLYCETIGIPFLNPPDRRAPPKVGYYYQALYPRCIRCGERFDAETPLAWAGRGRIHPGGCNYKGYPMPPNPITEWTNDKILRGEL